MRVGGVLLLVAPVLVVGCAGGGGSRGGAGGATVEARALIEQGEYDAALARLGGGSDPESLYLLGRAWAGKAAQKRVGPAGALGPEETQALDFFERAVAARPDDAPAHLAIAELLAPHVVAGEGTVPRGPAGAVSVARVLEAYGQAVQADPADAGAVEGLIAFALRMGRLAEAEAGFQELVRRDRENPEILVRYGDFLSGVKQDREAALGVYAQALIWRPEDTAIRGKVADLYVDAAAEHLDRDEYAQAEAQLREARKHTGDPGTPQAARLAQTEKLLAEASGRR